jgi:ferredoxin-NADP reductase
VLTCTREDEADREGQRIDADFLDANLRDREGYCYVCGPDGFVKAINDALLGLGVREDRLVHEH